MAWLIKSCTGRGCCAFPPPVKTAVVSLSLVMTATLMIPLSSSALAEDDTVLSGACSLPCAESEVSSTPSSLEDLNARSSLGGLNAESSPRGLNGGGDRPFDWKRSSFASASFLAFFFSAFLSAFVLAIALGQAPLQRTHGSRLASRGGSSFMKHGIPCCWLVVK